MYSPFQVQDRDNIYSRAFEIIDFGNKNKKRLSDIAYATAHKKLKQHKRAANANVNANINEI